MPKPSTFSIVACDLDERAWGVAVASKFPAVGAIVPWAQAEAGAVATQAYADVSFGPRGLALMGSGLSAEETLSRLLSNDADRAQRQVGMVDAHGNAVSFTGTDCFEWAGGRIGPCYAIQGNILASEQVISEMERVFLDAEGSLPSRLCAALLAGDLAGGDRRGRQSAAIYVAKPNGGYGGTVDRWVDYRVDDHEDPVPRLGELLEMHELYFGKSEKKDRVPLNGRPLQQLQEILIRLYYLDGKADSQYDQRTQTALRAFTGNENFEERCDLEAGWIDRPVLEYLLKKFRT
jgi:uncharacterized Ntn-hydrolase superfamily protein